jgi:excisionase family DNA binding protein
MTIKEAALELKLNPATIRRYIAKKKIRVMQAGKCTAIRIPLQEWERFLRGR